MPLRPKRLFFVDSKGNVKEFFGSGFGRFRLVSRWCLGLFASKATACVLLFGAFGSGVPRPDFARPKRLFFVDSKGNVKEFFGSGFGRFPLVSRWCLGLFASKATACVLLLEAFGSGVPRPDFARPKRLFFVASKRNVKEFFGSGFGRFRVVSRWCLGLFASKATACVLLFEAFGSGVPRPHFARPKRLFFVDSKGNVKEFFGSGFGRLCLGLFASKATACVLLFEAFGSGVPRPHFARPKRLFFVDSKGNVKEFFGSGFGRLCLGLFASKATACVLLFEAFGSGVPRPDFARPKRLFFVDSKRNVKEFLWLVFCMPGARTLLLLRLSEVYSKARVRNAFGAIPVEALTMVS